MSKSKKTRRKTPRHAQLENDLWWMKFLTWTFIIIASIIGCDYMVVA